jgi:large subunit ribosomal protein L19
MNKLDIIEKENCKENITDFNIGDTVKVHYKIIEGTKERIQVFEGLVIARKNGSVRETFTVRKISFGIGVERTFPLHSPKIDKMEVVRHGRVRRAKLYYIRGLSGKAGMNVKEKIQMKSLQEKKSNTKKVKSVKNNDKEIIKKEEDNLKIEPKE